MAWSIFHNVFSGTGTSTISKAQGQAQAEGWAYDLAKALFGTPTQGQVQFFYDWEIAEGGGGRFNPLNIGRDPKHPSWSGGSQYGGGASDYGNITQNLIATQDYLHMPNYQGILVDLKANKISQAVTDLKKSPWASGHYAGGFPTTKLPVPIKAGGLTSSYKPPGLLDTIFGTIENIPSATARVGKDIGGGAEAGAKDVVGIGSWFTKNLTLILVVLVVVVIIKK